MTEMEVMEYRAMRNQSIKSNAILAFVSVLTIFAVVSCGPGDSESRGQARELRERLEDEQQRYADLEQEANSLREENRRLQSELAAETGGAGLDISERQRLLDDRRAALDALESDLVKRQTEVAQREDWIQRQSQEFYERTNMTMEDIGEARQIKTEYESMRSQRDEAVAKAEGWLKFIWGVSIFCGLSVLAICVLIVRSMSMHAQHKREMEYRRDVAELLGKAISSNLPHEQAQTVLEAFDRFASIDTNRGDGDVNALPESS